MFNKLISLKSGRLEEASIATTRQQLSANSYVSVPKRRSLDFRNSQDLSRELWMRGRVSWRGEEAVEETLKRKEGPASRRGEAEGMTIGGRVSSAEIGLGGSAMQILASPMSPSGGRRE